jgi:hypothetical protein
LSQKPGLFGGPETGFLCTHLALGCQNCRRNPVSWLFLGCGGPETGFLCTHLALGCQNCRRNPVSWLRGARNRVSLHSSRAWMPKLSQKPGFFGRPETGFLCTHLALGCQNCRRNPVSSEGQKPGFFGGLETGFLCTHLALGCQNFCRNPVSVAETRFLGFLVV